MTQSSDPPLADRSPFRETEASPSLLFPFLRSHWKTVHRHTLTQSSHCVPGKLESPHCPVEAPPIVSAHHNNVRYILQLLCLIESKTEVQRDSLLQLLQKLNLTCNKCQLIISQNKMHCVCIHVHVCTWVWHGCIYVGPYVGPDCPCAPIRVGLCRGLLTVEGTRVCCGSLKASTRSTDLSLQCWRSNLGHLHAKQALFFLATSLGFGLMTVQAGLQFPITRPQPLPTAGIIGTYNGACPAHTTSSRPSRKINMVKMCLTSSPPTPPQPCSNTKCVNSAPATVEGTDPGFLWLFQAPTDRAHWSTDPRLMLHHEIMKERSFLGGGEGLHSY